MKIKNRPVRVMLFAFVGSLAVACSSGSSTYVGTPASGASSFSGASARAGGPTDTPDAAGAGGIEDNGEPPNTAGSGAAPSPILDAPDNRADLMMFLDARRYADWPAEPSYHPSSGPHGNSVKVFYSPKAAQALTAKVASFPMGAAVVKEAAQADGTLIGWSAWVKVKSESDGGRGFYWYEIAGASVFADGLGAPGCIGCHAMGSDFLLSAGTFE